MSKRRKHTTHEPNGPYYPVGLMGGEYCRCCRETWPCPTVRAVTEALEADQ